MRSPVSLSACLPVVAIGADKGPFMLWVLGQRRDSPLGEVSNHRAGPINAQRRQVIVFVARTIS
jgi:hypothetical protein